MTTRLENLLEQAYDAEQAGNHTLAAELRAQYHTQQQAVQAEPAASIDEPTPTPIEDAAAVPATQSTTAELCAQIDATPDYATKRRLIFRLIDTVLDTGAGLPGHPPFGTLADGTPIMGEFDYTFPDQRARCVHVHLDGFSATADSKGHISAGNDDETIVLDGVTLPDLTVLRAFLASDAPERLLIAAKAWASGEPEPPTFTPPVAPIQVHITHHGDEGDIWAKFTAGDGLTQVQIAPDGIDRPRVDLSIGGRGINELADQIITLEDLHQIRDNLNAILADPRLAGYMPPSILLAPTVRVEQFVGDLDVDGTRLTGTSFLSGEGNDAVEVFFPDQRNTPYDVPLLCVPDQEALPLDKVDRDLPHIVALMNDPRVREARVRYEVGAPMKKAA